MSIPLSIFQYFLFLKIMLLSYSFCLLLLFLVADNKQTEVNDTKCSLDPMVFPPPGNFKSTSICQLFASCSTTWSANNQQICKFIHLLCQRLTIIAFCKVSFRQSAAIIFDRCAVGGKWTFWTPVIPNHELDHLRRHYLKCLETKTILTHNLSLGHQ